MNEEMRQKGPKIVDDSPAPLISLSVVLLPLWERCLVISKGKGECEGWLENWSNVWWLGSFSASFGIWFNNVVRSCFDTVLSCDTSYMLNTKWILSSMEPL